jgi:hypothetical protein
MTHNNELANANTLGGPITTPWGEIMSSYYWYDDLCLPQGVQPDFIEPFGTPWDAGSKTYGDYIESLYEHDKALYNWVEEHKEAYRNEWPCLWKHELEEQNRLLVASFLRILDTYHKAYQEHKNYTSRQNNS